MDPNPQAPPLYLARQSRKRHLAAVWANLAGLTPGMTVLDIGSGPGLLATGYARLVGPEGKVYALERAVGLHEPQPNLIPLRQDATAAIILPRPPDIVFLTDTLHHAADPPALLASVRAVCAPATRLLVTEYEPAQPGLVGAKRERRLPRAITFALLAAAGFEILWSGDAEDEHYAVLATPLATPGAHPGG